MPGWPTCAYSYGKFSSHLSGIRAKSTEIPPRRAGSLLIYIIFLQEFLKEGEISPRLGSPLNRTSSPPYEQPLRNRQLETDIHIKPTETGQFLDSTSCHQRDCKKSIPYSQALRYNRIYSDNEKFDQRCNDLEKRLIEKGYSERMVRTQILKGSGESRVNFE